MTLITTGEEGGSSEDILAAAEKHFKRIAETMDATIETLKTAADRGDRDAVDMVRAYSKALQTVFDERIKLEKLRKQTAGIHGGYALDFEAARDEIGRRLACLRAAANTGGFSE